MLDLPTATHMLADAAVGVAADSTSLDALGSDVFTFLIASVLVVPFSRLVGVNQTLVFLIVGCILGPYGLSFFSASEANYELGDIGIDFLLFIEGLQLSPERLKKLGGFFRLGVAQFLLTIAILTAANLCLAPQILPLAERFVPLDDSLVRPILTSPVVAFCLASAGALSSSAFVLPVLKAKGWEERPDGTAALATLLLQDIAVAPLLVILPLIAGAGPQSSQELGVLVAKGTFGFGGVLAVGSVALRQFFSVVAAAQSSETFVAAALLVAIGMGAAAQGLGLSTTTGAFAAGVLLAGSQYRQQIEADILPFEGILLGIFFMTAGASLDPNMVVDEWPTLLSGTLAFLGAKLGLLFVLGAFSFGLTRAEAIRTALLLAGGGEFAFVVLKLSDNLGLLPGKLASLLTASVIISMSLTPVLGEMAEVVGEAVETIDAEGGAQAKADALFETIDEDGSGVIEKSELRSYLLGGTSVGLAGDGDSSNTSFEQLFEQLDLNGDGVVSKFELRQGYTELILGEARDAALRYADDEASAAEMATAPDAFVVCGYGEMGQRVCEVLAERGADAAHVVAFDRNPVRISSGLAKEQRVVYGDGASPELLSAAGVRRPRAIVVTYANDRRVLEATGRLREAFPGVPILVRARTTLEAEPLLRAGATEAMIEAEEAAVRFGALVLDEQAPPVADSVGRTAQLAKEVEDKT